MYLDHPDNRNMPTPPITSFTGQYRFLSNFFPCEIDMDGDTYRTLEHAYQAAKTTDPTQRWRIQNCATPGQAKRIGQRVTRRDGWDAARLVVMELLLHQKFKDPNLRSKLVATGDAELIEGNYWGDVFWGVCEGKGENWLGKLLMRVRDAAIDT